MQPFPIPYEPTNLRPCQTIRVRGEAKPIDTTNSRLVEHWQTDSPSLQYSRRDVSGAIFYMDMNGTPSRLYREDLRTSPVYTLPTGASKEVKKTIDLNEKVSQKLIEIQNLGNEINKAFGQKAVSLKKELNKKQEEYQILLLQQKQIQVDSLSDNPYFNKYDVAGDPRNIVRELRGTVTEDIVDRGVRESKGFLKREFESRWLPPAYAETQGIDSLSAYELMKPKTNDNSKWYR